MRTSNSRGAVLLLLSQGVQLATQMASLVLLSHLLPPRAFGIVAMVSSVIGLANVLGAFGLSLSALSGATPSEIERSNLFWINAVAGFTAMIVVAACGPLLAAFYGRSILTGITAVLAVPFFLAALSVQFKIELNLSKRWSRLALVQAGPPLIALPFAAVLAAVTRSYWALVAQAVLMALLQLGLSVGLSGWRPMRPRRDSGLRRHLKFGRDTTIIQTLNYAASNADNVVIGRALGSAALGEYNRAYNLALLPLNQISVPLEQIILPRLSAALDGTLDEVALRCQRVMIYAQLIPLSVLVGSAYPLVRVGLGSHWLPVSALIQILGIGAAASAAGYIFWWLLLVKRRTGLLVFSEGIIEVAMVIAMVGVVNLGSQAVAWAVAGGQTLMLIGSALLCNRHADVKVVALAKASMPGVVLATAAALVSNVAGRLRWPDAAVALAVSVGSWMLCCLIVWSLSARVRADIGYIRELLGSAARRST
jgi:polysaccharide transporter, PST family